MESLEPQGKCLLETIEKARYSSVYRTVILKLTHVMPSNTINVISLVSTFVVVDSITCVNFSKIYRNGTNFINKNLFSRIKSDQLDVTCFFMSLFNAQHVSDVNTSIFRSLRLIC